MESLSDRAVLSTGALELGSKLVDTPVIGQHCSYVLTREECQEKLTCPLVPVHRTVHSERLHNSFWMKWCFKELEALQYYKYKPYLKFDIFDDQPNFSSCLCKEQCWSPISINTLLFEMGILMK